MKGRSRVLTVTVFVMTVALIGLGAWVIYDTSKDGRTTVPDEIDQLLDSYFAAFNTYDVDAVRAVITEDYMMYGSGIEPNFNVSTPLVNALDAEEILSDVELVFPLAELQWERLGEPIMTGDGPWVVAQAVRTTSPQDAIYFPGGVEGVSTWTVVEEDGTLRIARDVLVAFGLK